MTQLWRVGRIAEVLAGPRLCATSSELVFKPQASAEDVRRGIVA